MGKKPCYSKTPWNILTYFSKIVLVPYPGTLLLWWTFSSLLELEPLSHLHHWLSSVWEVKYLKLDVKQTLPCQLLEQVTAWRTESISRPIDAVAQSVLWLIHTLFLLASIPSLHSFVNIAASSNTCSIDIRQKKKTPVVINIPILCLSRLQLNKVIFTVGM